MKKACLFKALFGIILVLLVVYGGILIITSPKVGSDIASDLVVTKMAELDENGIPIPGSSYSQYDPINLYITTILVSISRIVLGGIMLLIGGRGFFYWLSCKRVSTVVNCKKENGAENEESTIFM